MIKTLCLLTCATWAVPAVADDYIAYPDAPTTYPFQRSFLTGRAVAVSPYRHLFPVRVFVTPQRDPYYNVPPYAVVAPR